MCAESMLCRSQCLRVTIDNIERDVYSFSIQQRNDYYKHQQISNTPSLNSHSNSDVCTKYQEASKIVNLALTGLISQCIPGAKVLDLCNFGTTVIQTQSAKLYQKKVNGVAVERGVAFPVCVSVNDVICNHSPLASEETVSVYFVCFVGCLCIALI